MHMENTCFELFVNACLNAIYTVVTKCLSPIMYKLT